MAIFVSNSGDGDRQMSRKHHHKSQKKQKKKKSQGKSRKQQRDEYLAQSKKRVDQMEEDLRADTVKRKNEAKKRHAQAQKEADLKEKRAERQRKVKEQWRKKEIARREKLEEDKKRKAEEKRKEEAKRAEERKMEKQRKEYLRTMRWAAGMRRAKDKQKKKAQQAKLGMMSDARSHEAHRVERINRDAQQAERKTEKASKKERGDLDGLEKELLADINEDIRQRKNKLFAKEQTEKQNMESEWRRRQYKLRGITDPSLLVRTKGELKRQEQSELRKFRARYNKLRTELEVERTQRTDEVRRSMKKARSNVTKEERLQKTTIRATASQQRLEAMFERQHKFKEAKNLEKDMLQWDITEALEEEIGSRDGDDEDED